MRLTSGALLLILLASVPPHAAADDQLAKLLARPVSPGTLALLISHAKEPEAQARWRHALAHDNPQVRATAARLLHMSGLTSAIPELKAALARESDPDAAMQTGRALAALGGTDVDALVLDAAARLSSRQLALALVQARGSSAIAHLDALRALNLEDDVELEVAMLLTGGDAPRLNLIAGAALEAADVNLWEAVLGTAYRQSLELDATLVNAALTSSSETIADLAWWHVALLAAGKTPLQDLPQEPRAVDGRDTPPELAFGRELAARAMRAAPVEQPAFVARVSKRTTDFSLPPHLQEALRGSLLPLLTGTERDAVVGNAPLATDSRFAKELASPSPKGEYRVIRSIGDLPVGYVSDVLRQTGCKPGDDEQVSGAVVRYGARHNVLGLQWVATRLSKACDLASRYITAAGLVPPTTATVAGQPELVILPMRKSFLQCIDRASSAQREDVAAGMPVLVRPNVIAPPKKTRDVRPIYPATRLAAREDGLVMLESTISPTGCVSRVEVTRGSGTEFDISALRAVAGWEFTPTTLAGRPVPVTLTVTVQFTMR